MYQENASACRDFFELRAGARHPSGQQRLYILAFKEARVSGRLTPTEYTLADALMKPMTARVIRSSSNSVTWRGATRYFAAFLIHKNSREEDLRKDDVAIKKEANEGRSTILPAAVGLFTKFTTSRRPEGQRRS